MMSLQRLVWAVAVAAVAGGDECSAVLELAAVDLGGDEVRAGASLLEAFRGVGTAAVVNHGVDVAATLAAGRSLFRETAAGEKRALDAGGGVGVRQRGFLGRGAEAGGAEVVEAKEGFAFGALENVWPSAASEASAVLAEAHANLTSAARRVVAAAAAAGAARLRNCCDGDAEDSALSRLFAYDAAAPGYTGSASHTDWGLLTLVLADDVLGDGGALEFDVDGTWRAAAAPPGALVVNAGDFFALSHAGVRSPRHRVVLKPTPRLSLVYFFYPDTSTPVPEATQDAEVLSLLQCQAPDGECPAPRDASFGALIEAKWRQVSRRAAPPGS